MDIDSTNSKKQILKSTGIIGSSQVFTIILQVVRTKIIAVLLGPIGVGLLGIYNTIVDLIRNTTGLGINFSGVREIAQANESENTEEFSKKVKLLKRWALITGLVGAIILILFSYPISLLSFGDSGYCIELIFLSLAILFTSLNQAQLAILQGARRLKDMAISSVIGVSLSIIIVTPIYYFFNIKGMVCAIVLMSLSSLLLSNYYVSKLKVTPVTLSVKETWDSGKEMIKIGVANSISGIITTVSMYFIRSFISHQGSLDDVGFFQSAWTISNVYLLSVLNAMAADYFPRLSAINKDNRKVNKLVNEQTEVAIIVGGLLVTLMLLLSGIIISILYSEKFQPSAVLLLFFALGSFFKLISWPICYVSAAKGAISQILISEVSWNIIFVTCSAILWHYYGLIGIGISYVISYILYSLIVFGLVNKLTSFKWTATNIKHIAFYLVIVTIAFLSIFIFDIGWVVRVAILVIGSTYSYKYISNIVSINDIINKIRKTR